MKTISGLIAAVMALSVFATAGFAHGMPAWSDVTTYLDASGTTSAMSLATVSGYDWSEKSFQMTGYVAEELFNDGSIFMAREVYNPGQWELQESKYVEGSGETDIMKAVAWWTEDSTKTCDGHCMKYPTETSIFRGFYTNTMTDEVQVYNKADSTVSEKPGEFSFGSFMDTINTFAKFTYVESVGINMDLDCEPGTPEMPTPPSCKGEQCPP